MNTPALLRAPTLPRDLDREAWNARREIGTFDVTPKKLIEEGVSVVVDYSSATTKIDRAVFHLDEALPDGAKRRAELAFRLLREGVLELGLWMRARGLDV
jgi:hypothetical protein